MRSSNFQNLETLISYVILQGTACQSLDQRWLGRQMVFNLITMVYEKCIILYRAVN